MLYDKLYRESSEHILWGQQPGRLVARIKEYMPSGKVLDMGCGDGKNSFFLEQEGFSVVGVDRSACAMDGLQNRFRRAGRTPQGVYFVGDIESDTEITKESEAYDALISYGIFHCLNPSTRIETQRRYQSLVKPEGLLIFTCLTDVIEMPLNHGTDSITLVNEQEIDAVFSGWERTYEERGIIVEDHLPVIGEHQHSAVWIIAQRK